MKPVRNSLPAHRARLAAVLRAAKEALGALKSIASAKRPDAEYPNLLYKFHEYRGLEI